MQEALLYESYIVAVAPGILLLRAEFDKAMDMLLEYLSSNEKITLGEFRDLLGTSRKYAMALLEFCDRRGVTKKTGDARGIGNIHPSAITF